MLSLLHIENIAVIESADIQFDRGFNALTGETGAGKSRCHWSGDRGPDLPRSDPHRGPVGLGECAFFGASGALLVFRKRDGAG